MTQTIGQDRLAGRTVPPAPRVWTGRDLELADARIVAELAHRVEICAALADSADERPSIPARERILSDPTVRELLAVVEILTRRETARLAGRRRPT
jgi:hypothetical protein